MKKSPAEIFVPAPQGEFGVDHTWARPMHDLGGRIEVVPTPVLNPEQRKLADKLPAQVRDRFLLELNNEVGFFLAERAKVPYQPPATVRDDAAGVAKACTKLRQAMDKVSPATLQALNFAARSRRLQAAESNDAIMTALDERLLLDRLTDVLTEVEMVAACVKGSAAEAVDPDARIDRYEAGQFAWAVCRAFLTATRDTPPKSRWFVDVVQDAAEALVPEVKVGEESTFAAIDELRSWRKKFPNRPAPLMRRAKPG